MPSRITKLLLQDELLDISSSYLQTQIDDINDRTILVYNTIEENGRAGLSFKINDTTRFEIRFSNENASEGPGIRIGTTMKDSNGVETIYPLIFANSALGAGDTYSIFWPFRVSDWNNPPPAYIFVSSTTSVNGPVNLGGNAHMCIQLNPNTYWTAQLAFGFNDNSGIAKREREGGDDGSKTWNAWRYNQF